jgi:hypothetical protein
VENRLKCLSANRQTNLTKKAGEIGKVYRNVDEKFIGTIGKFGPELVGMEAISDSEKPCVARVQLTLCSIRSLSATIAMNSLFVGFDFEILIV